MEGRKDHNALFKHQENHHNGDRPAYEFKSEEFFINSLEKGIFEGVYIDHSPSSPGLLMNSKAEYRQGEVRRVAIVRGLGD